MALPTYGRSKMRNEIVITEANFETEVLDSTVPVLVDCRPPWCGLCGQLAPAIEQISVEQAGSLKVGKVNVDDEPSTPTTPVYRVSPSWRFTATGGPWPGPSAFSPSMCSRGRSAWRRLMLLPDGRASWMFA
jgi:thioredoxin 1